MKRGRGIRLCGALCVCVCVCVLLSHFPSPHPPPIPCTTTATTAIRQENNPTDAVDSPLPSFPILCGEAADAVASVVVALLSSWVCTPLRLLLSFPFPSRSTAPVGGGGGNSSLSERVFFSRFSLCSSFPSHQLEQRWFSLSPPSFSPPPPPPSSSPR